MREMLLCSKLSVEIETNWLAPPGGNSLNWFRARVIDCKLVKLAKRASYLGYKKYAIFVC